MKCYLTFDYFIQFLYLKTNDRPRKNKNKLKIADCFICIFTLLYFYLCCCLKLDRFLFSLFLFDSIYIYSDYL